MDRLAREAGISAKRTNAALGGGKIGDEPVMLAKPITYMNASGEAVAGLLTKLKLEPAGCSSSPTRSTFPRVLRLKARGPRRGRRD